MHKKEGEAKRRGTNTVSTAGFLLLLSLRISLPLMLLSLFPCHLPSVHPGIANRSVRKDETHNPRRGSVSTKDKGWICSRA